MRKLWTLRATPAATATLLALMALALAAFYRPFYFTEPLLEIPAAGSFTLLIALVTLGAFGLLALVRPDLALVFVPLTAPLFYRSRGFWDAAVPAINNKFFPVHELVLVVALLATLLTTRWWRIRPDWRSPALWLPLGWLVVGALGVLIATPEGRAAALREWRWMFLEPVLFYGLVRFWLARGAQPRLLAWGLLAAGVAVAVVGLMQWAGIDLIERRLLKEGTSNCFSDFIVDSGGVRRTSSVFCHPNNLALWQDRTWPLALVLALEAGWLLWRDRRPEPRRLAALLVLGAVFVLTGLSMLWAYSKGARFAGALVIFGLALLPRRWWFAAATGALLATLLAVSSLSGPERLSVTGDSSFARINIWRSALAMIADHPVAGIGLDQFFYYFNPEFGRGYMHPDVHPDERFTSHPHNIILDLWLRVGLVGAAIFALLMARAARATWRLWQTKAPDRWLALGMASTVAVGLLHGLVDQGYFSADLALTTWLALALIDGSEPTA